MPPAICGRDRLDLAAHARPSSRRSAGRARIRRARECPPSVIVQVITSASVFEPREMVKVPAIGKRSARRPKGHAS